MSIELLRPSTHLSPSQTLAIAQYASTLLPSLQPSRFSLPWPLSFILPSQRESPEKWQIYENTLIALLTSSADDTALKFLSALDSRFSQDNERIQALHGIYEEAVAKDDKALKMILSKYDKLLELNPINMHIRKRRIALLLSMGRIEDGTKALVELLDVSPTDPEAWAELAEIYARNENWEKAVYCWEETILIIPNAWNVHARLGELEWLWAKSVDSHAERVRLVSTAMKSYCRSIELCDDYLRGYYGLKLVSCDSTKSLDDWMLIV